MQVDKSQPAPPSSSPPSSLTHSLTLVAPSFAAASSGLLPTCPGCLDASLAAPPALPRPGLLLPPKTLSWPRPGSRAGKDHAGINLG